MLRGHEIHSSALKIQCVCRKSFFFFCYVETFFHCFHILSLNYVTKSLSEQIQPRALCCNVQSVIKFAGFFWITLISTTFSVIASCFCSTPCIAIAGFVNLLASSIAVFFDSENLRKPGCYFPSIYALINKAHQLHLRISSVKKGFTVLTNLYFLWIIFISCYLLELNY